MKSKKIFFLVILVIAIALLLNGWTHGKILTKEEIKKQIQGKLDEFTKIYEKSTPDKHDSLIKLVRELYFKDVVIVPPGKEMIVGIDSILKPDYA